MHIGSTEAKPQPNDAERILSNKKPAIVDVPAGMN